jgi:hypothetical protein
MTTAEHALQVLHWASALVVLAEALNKIERTDPLAPGLCVRQRMVESLKALAWLPLALGAAGALAGPVLLVLGAQAVQVHGWLRMGPPTLDQCMVMLGFAVLIIRTRVKEG